MQLCMQGAHLRRYAFLFGKESLHGEYQGLYATGRSLTCKENSLLSDDVQRPVLLIGGTSITLNDQRELIQHLIASGMTVAAIDYPMGSLLGPAIRPKLFRKSAFRDFVSRLKEDRHVKGIDIVAHSYAAFEVVRTLMSDPVGYRSWVKSVLFINPPGFRKKIGAVTHCLRFILGYVLLGWLKMFAHMVGLGRRPIEEDDPWKTIYIRRQICGIAAMACRAFKDPLRSYREARDIVSFNIVPAMAALSQQYGYDLNLFLNVDDAIVPFKDTLNAVLGFLPGENILIARGGHNDLIFQDWQREAFTSFLRRIRCRSLAHPRARKA